jgi:hypothetical protein
MMASRRLFWQADDALKLTRIDTRQVQVPTRAFYLAASAPGLTLYANHITNHRGNHGY